MLSHLRQFSIKQLPNKKLQNNVIPHCVTVSPRIYQLILVSVICRQRTHPKALMVLFNGDLSACASHLAIILMKPTGMQF